MGVKALFIEPGSPWENGYVESLNGKLRDELLDREVFETLPEARVLIARWRDRYNTARPRSSLGHRPPDPETIAVRLPPKPCPHLQSISRSQCSHDSPAPSPVSLGPVPSNWAIVGAQRVSWPNGVLDSDRA